jgi:hypothetical protein
MGLVIRIACILSLTALTACSERANTPVSGDLFHAALPGEWSQVSARPDLYVYGSTSGDARVTFSTFLSRELMSPAKQRETLQKLAEHHRAAQLSEGAEVTLSPLQMSESQVTARFLGDDSQNRRRTATMLVGGPRGVVIVYLEVIGGDQPAFAARVEKLFAAVELR